MGDHVPIKNGPKRFVSKNVADAFDMLVEFKEMSTFTGKGCGRFLKLMGDVTNWHQPSAAQL